LDADPIGKPRDSGFFVGKVDGIWCVCSKPGRSRRNFTILLIRIDICHDTTGEAASIKCSKENMMLGQNERAVCKWEGELAMLAVLKLYLPGKIDEQ